ncbi:MAG: amidohydrolase family protein [Acidobacteria bacterium]|nr:amidohydrolase family protein [Acidobacteriota bacterium]
MRNAYRTLPIFALIFTALLLSQGAFAAAIEADMVIYNGQILTADSPDPNNFRTVQGAAIYGGSFIAVGSNDEVMQYAGPGTQKIDLGGRMVIPGLIETHNHIYSYGSHFFGGQPQVEKQAPTVTWTNKQDFLGQVRTIALSRKPGEWIVTMPGGGGIMGAPEELWRGDVNRFDLDKVTPDNPFVMHWSAMEEMVVNTLALNALLARYPDIRGVVRDDNGAPTGRLKGLANNTVRYEFWPQLSPAQIGPYYKGELEEMAAMGVTSNSTRLQPNHLAAYGWLHARGDMPVRMPFSLESGNRNPNAEATISRLTGLQGGSGKNMWGMGDDKLWIIGLSISNIDGVPSTGASCVTKEYPREAPAFPLWRFQFYGPHGMCTLTDPEFNDIETLRGAAKYGFRISGMHTGGDKGVNAFLDAVEEMARQYPDLPQRRWSLDHCRFLNEEQATRAERLGLMFSCGPKYVFAGERGDIGAYKVLYGEQVATDVVVPLRRLLNHGLRTTLQMDQHGFYTFLGLQVAVTRKDEQGKVWGAEQRVNRREALYMYTRWGAEYVLKENKLGSIEPKKYADFVVLDRDYLTVPEDEIGQINVLLTVVDGKIAFTNPQFASSMGLPQVGFREDPTWWDRNTSE